MHASQGPEMSAYSRVLLRRSGRSAGAAGIGGGEGAIRLGHGVRAGIAELVLDLGCAARDLAINRGRAAQQGANDEHGSEKEDDARHTDPHVQLLVTNHWKSRPRMPCLVDQK
jgi:hypothetical protein